MSLFDVSGKVAVITGSSRGIGRAAAERLAEHGAKVVISSRKFDACKTVADEINAARGPGTALAVAANISSKEDLTNLVGQDSRSLRENRHPRVQCGYQRAHGTDVHHHR